MRVVQVRRKALLMVVVVTLGLISATSMTGVPTASAAPYGTPSVTVGSFQASGDGASVSVTATLGDGGACGASGCQFVFAFACITADGMQSAASGGPTVSAPSGAQGTPAVAQTVSGCAPSSGTGALDTLSVRVTAWNTFVGSTWDYRTSDWVVLKTGRDYSADIAGVNALWVAGADVCFPLIGVPPQAPDTDVSIPWQDCEAEAEGPSHNMWKLVGRALLSGGWRFVDLLTRAPDTSPTTTASTTSSAATTTASPTTTTTTSAPPLTLDQLATTVAGAWGTRTIGPTTVSPKPTAAQLKTVAKQCITSVQASGVVLSAAAFQCQTSAVLVPGGMAGKGKEAAQHDAAVIAAHPAWVELTYMSAKEKGKTGVVRDWYTKAPFKSGCSSKTGAQECDEYPLYATTQSGPNAWATAGSIVLKPVLRADNQTEGSAYGSMASTAACALNTATAVGTSGAGGSAFLVVPMPSLNSPSFFVCGESRSPA